MVDTEPRQSSSILPVGAVVGATVGASVELVVGANVGAKVGRGVGGCDGTEDSEGAVVFSCATVVVVVLKRSKPRRRALRKGLEFHMICFFY